MPRRQITLAWLCALIALTLGNVGLTQEDAPTLASEAVPASEARDIAKVAARFQAAIIERDGDGLTRRGAHPKHHGCLRAKFTINAELRPDLRVGLFQPGASYPAWIRYSNNGDPQADSEGDVRGMIKVKKQDIAISLALASPRRAQLAKRIAPHAKEQQDCDMPNYRRAWHIGGTYFFTVNLLQRQHNDRLIRHIDSLCDVVRSVRSRWPFYIHAWVVLPEQLHCVIELPPGDSDFATGWRLIKMEFSKALPKTERLSAVRAANAASDNGGSGNI